MWGHGHRKGRLSLPSIRISTAADFTKSTSSFNSPVDPKLYNSQPATALTASTPISHDFYNSSNSNNSTNPGHHSSTNGRGGRQSPVAPRSTSHGESVASSSSFHDSTRSKLQQDGTLSPQSRDNKQLLPGFKHSSAQTLRERQQNHDDLFRSLRGDYRPTTATNEEVFDNQSIVDFETAANDPFMPHELMAAIQTSMKNCAEYERQCAQLEHSIEHKTLMWSHILEQYEGQDHTATSLRELISSAQSSLQTARPTMSIAENTASEAFEKLQKHELMLEKTKLLVENSKKTMDALEQYIKEQEVLHGKIEKWHSALFGTAAGLIVLIAIILAWLLR